MASLFLENLTLQGSVSFLTRGGTFYIVEIELSRS